MRNALKSAAIAVLLASSALCQVTIPAHSSVYNGFSRGFNFTAPGPFVISQLDLPLDAHQAGDTAGYLVRVNGTVALYSTGNAGPVATNILVNSGDVVDVIGNWSPAVPGNFTAHNSYGNSAPFATTIEGLPATLNRTGWQWDIGDPLYTSGAYLAATSGSIGRVLMYTSPAAGHASASPYGAGCPAPRSMAVYEVYNLATFDLSNSSLMFLPNGNGSYTIIPGTNTWFAGFTTNLGLTDDSTTNVTLPFTFPHAGGSATTVSPSSNGFLWLASSTNSACCSGAVATFLSDLPRIAACWMDLNPGAGGGVYADLDPATGEFVFTWSQVPEFGQTNVMDMQIALQASGIFEIRFGANNINAANVSLTGYSVGGGAADPGSSDLSTVVTTPIVTGAAAQPVTLGASARPVLGTSINLDTGGITGGPIFGINSLSFVGINPGIDLTAFGAPGCSQYINPAVNRMFLPAGQTASLPLSIPNMPALAGVSIYNQSMVYAPSINALGLSFSNGLHLLLDAN